MKRMKQMFMLAAGLLALALIATFVAPKVGAAVKAALVEVVLPSHPIWQDYYLHPGDLITDGLTTGTLGVSSVTVTNSYADGTPISVEIVSVLTSGPNCTGAPAEQNPRMRFLAPANTTNHYVYPTPAVLGSCYQINIRSNFDHTGLGSVGVSINGFVN